MRGLCRNCVVSVVVILAVVLGLLMLPARGADPAGGGAVVLQPQMLFDPVLGKNAYSVLTPEGWKMQGAVTWPPGVPTAQFDISVANPVEHMAWREFPRLVFLDGVREYQTSLFPNQRNAIEQRFPEGTITPLGMEIRKQPASPREYVEKLLIPRFVREVAGVTDVNVVSETDLPEVAKAHTANDPFHRSAQTSRFRMTYTTPGGAVEREFVATIITGNAGNGSRPQFGNRPAAPEPVMWIAEVTTYRAPMGKLDGVMPLMATIESSLKVQLPWFNVECQVAEAYLTKQQEIEAEILKNQAGAIAEHGRIFHELAQNASDQVSDHIRDNFANQQRAKSENQEQFMHYINGTASFKDPNDGTTLTLSNSYKYQYISNQGGIFETDEPTLSPPVDPKTSWQLLEKTR